MNKSMAENPQECESLVEGNTPVIAPGEIVLGSVRTIDAQGNPTVSFPQLAASQPLVAVTTVAISHQHIGRQVALLFANGDLQRPIIIGLIHSPLFDLLENFSMLQSADASPGDSAFPVDDQAGDEAGDVDPFAGNQMIKTEPSGLEQTVQVDGKRVVIEGQEEIVLRCGESSITLTKAGKILIRGKYLLSRSSGVNRILGGSVQVN